MEMNKILKGHGNVMDIYFLDLFWTLTVLITEVESNELHLLALL